MQNSLKKYSVKTYLGFQGAAIINTIDIKSLTQKQAQKQAEKMIIKNVLINIHSIEQKSNENEFHIVVNVTSMGNSQHYDLFVKNVNQEDAIKESINRIKKSLVCISN